MYDQELVDKYYPTAHIYEAMAVWQLPKTKKDKIVEVCESGEYFAQLKKDGNWYELCKAANGEIYLFGRGESVTTSLPVEDIKKVPHIKEAFADLPNDTVILGEIYFPNATTNKVRSVMGCKSKKAIERQEKLGKLHFFMHDLLRLNGEDMSKTVAISRYNTLKKLCAHYRFTNEYVELAESVDVGIYTFLQKALANGEEGGVLKKKSGLYEEGKRPSWNMIKWKQHDTVDVVCMELLDATKVYSGTELSAWQYWLKKDKDEDEEYKKVKDFCYYAFEENPNLYIPVTKPYFYGWKTAIRIGVYKNGELTSIGTVSSGFDDKIRKDFTEHPEKYLNKVVELDCMLKTEDSLRHPRFIKFRDDKKPEECKFEEIFI